MRVRMGFLLTAQERVLLTAQARVLLTAQERVQLLDLLGFLFLVPPPLRVLPPPQLVPLRMLIPSLLRLHLRPALLVLVHRREDHAHDRLDRGSLRLGGWTDPSPSASPRGVRASGEMTKTRGAERMPPHWRQPRPLPSSEVGLAWVRVLGRCQSSWSVRRTE